MENLIKDLRFAVRSFLKRPGLLRPLQFPELERIVLFLGINPRQGINQSNMSVPDLADWQQQSQLFEQIAAFTSGPLT